MGWLPIFKRKPIGSERTTASGRAPRDGSPRTAAATADSVQQARTRARRRLIGAAVLVVAGVIGFPLLFETQPRPVPVDIPIEIPRRDGSPALAMPTARVPQASVAGASPTPPASSVSPPIIETEADAGREVRPMEAPGTPSNVAAAKPSTAASHAAVGDRDKPAVPTPSTRNADAERAAALLAGKPVAQAAAAGRPVVKSDAAGKVEPVVTKAPQAASTAASGPARFIVQAGAFADAAAARDTRVKLERLGLKTYTQVADTAGGPRVRVRLGPFATRADADKALAKAKAAGLAAVVITL